MRQAISAAGNEHECDDVEGTQARPQRQGRDEFGFLGDGVDHTTEKNGLRDGNHGQHDVCAADQKHALLFGG